MNTREIIRPGSSPTSFYYYYYFFIFFFLKTAPAPAVLLRSGLVKFHRQEEKNVTLRKNVLLVTSTSENAALNLVQF